MMPAPLSLMPVGQTFEVVAKLATEAENMQGRRGTAYDLLVDYLVWAGEAHRRLLHPVGAAAARELIYGRRHGDLLGLVDVARIAGNDRPMDAPIAYAPNAARFDPAERLVNVTLMAELTDVAKALRETLDALVAEDKHWSQTATLLVPDTSFFMHQFGGLPGLIFGKLLGIEQQAGYGFHVVVPIAVLDQLDRLKDRGSSDQRSHARQALKALGGFWDTGDDRMRRGVWRDGGDEPVTVELLPDPRSHTRLPIDDDEIIDRAAWVAETAGCTVRLATYDLHMATRGRLARLQVTHLHS
ncbi:PIN domain-containing protein [Cryptosporangium sp. NPDC051539]|uniref:PIN domain-containing protein n=1 Tax=Cryptosporangium sp. NPDC051539 TaxID=3363962 RepID=UPI0037B269F6